MSQTRARAAVEGAQRHAALSGVLVFGLLLPAFAETQDARSLREIIISQVKSGPMHAFVELDGRPERVQVVKADARNIVMNLRGGEMRFAWTAVSDCWLADLAVPAVSGNADGQVLLACYALEKGWTERARKALEAGWELGAHPEILRQLELRMSGGAAVSASELEMPATPVAEPPAASHAAPSAKSIPIPAGIATNASNFGIAARHPGDAGIARDPRVIFADDFEGWESGGSTFRAGTWDGSTGRSGVLKKVLAVPGNVSVVGRPIGKHALMLACARGGPTAAGLKKHLGNYSSASEGRGPGHEELYVRYYQKFDAACVPVRNHGANLGGRDVTRPGSRFVGMSDCTDVSAHGYFFSGLQPYDEGNRMWWGFYSYHMDKRFRGQPGRWGDSYQPTESEKKYIEVDRWYCLERHMKLNTVGQADGLEELWVDGELAYRREGLRFRKVPELRIAILCLEVYYHGLPDRYTEENPCKVYFDNLVIATERIGCIRP